MASNSVSVPCPKTVSLVAAGVGSNSATSNQSKVKMVSFGSSSSFVRRARKLSAVARINARLNEVAAEKSSNSAPSLEGKSEATEFKVPDASSVNAFMEQVSELVKLVDSRDVVELQLKQMDCEVTIRKKEALKQPDAAAPTFSMQPPYPPAMVPTPPTAAPAPAAASASAASTAPAPALPPPAKKSSSSSAHPPLKCPMAGTFYRSPAPGEPPFVKVGDKVQKGQVVCIVEAMKLMNEIEADQSGTITEILAEDGKSVSVDMPLFVITP